jgi:phage repressor protein C with HTH and peptisase S24 domain
VSRSEVSSLDIEEDDYAARGFAERLEVALGRQEKGVIARRSRIAASTFTKYLAGGSEPGAFKAARLAESLGVNLTWLLTGRGLPNAAAAGYVGVPIYDVRLAAGAATFAEAARVIGEAPFDIALLRQIGRITADGLGVVEADGDSMEPTIPDGARVLLDLNDTRLREGIFGFRLDDELRIKRLRRMSDGVEVISDNPRYPAEILQGADLERFAIIGRAWWMGATL